MSLHPRRVTFTGIEGNRLEGDIYGHGKRTALLLHGGGQTRHAWRATARKLAGRGFTAIPVDQRGHGDSAWIESGAYALHDYGMEAASLGDQVEQRFGAKPVAIGASLGGLAALLALGQATCFSALVLVDIVPRTEAGGVAHVENFMRARAREGFVSIDEAAESIAAYLPHRTKPRSTEGLRKNLRQRADGRWYWHWDPRFWDGPRSVDVDRGAAFPRLEQISRSLTIPILLVRGGSSDIVSLESVEAFRRLAPHAEFVDVSGAGHMVAGDKNDVFADAILTFLG
jgi:pimeloyl-ACP methyl ester carboxylesterase